ncbi:2-dehydropantoate 2-reductase [Acetomicrobium sp.]|uniref:ketopantoate reductase family protein n=1 Tax=Acetomicrobium sp. TaxID=1872099 RepID=UPI002FC74376
MKIAVLGAGSMGCVYGGILAKAGYDVTLIDVWAEHVKAIQENGLIINENGSDIIIKNIKAVTDPREVGEVDLVIVLVKATVTEQAMEGAKSLIGENTRVLTLQNGLDNIEKLIKVVGKEKVLAGVTEHGANMLAPGRVQHAGTGDTIIGELDGKLSNSLRKIGSVFEKAGLRVCYSNNVMGAVWRKLLVNVGINALTSITGLRNGRLIELEETDELLRLAVREAVSIANAKGIDLELADPVEHVRDVARMTGKKSILHAPGRNEETQNRN